MNLIKCLMTQSSCYKGTSKGVPVGILWHDTGAGNQNVKRYVQPDDKAANRAELLRIIGTNANKNDYNHVSNEKGLNAFIGKLADGSVGTVQCLPWNYRPWGCGSGPKGSCNGSPYANNGPHWIQFEICDDGYNSKSYFDKVYKEAVELTAYLCMKYGIDPHGSVQYKDPKKQIPVTVPTILCHQDSYKLGLGSGHADVYLWFDKFGKTMDDVRRDVAAAIAAQQQQDGPEPEPEKEEDMTKEIKAMVKAEVAAQTKTFPQTVKDIFAELTKAGNDALNDNDAGKWSKAAREWAIAKGLTVGNGPGPDGKPNYAWQMPVSFERFMTVLYRYDQMKNAHEADSTPAAEA